MAVPSHTDRLFLNVVDAALTSPGVAELLTDDELARLEKVSRPPLIYPHWHQAATASDRLGPADLALLRPFLS